MSSSKKKQKSHSLKKWWRWQEFGWKCSFVWPEPLMILNEKCVFLQWTLHVGMSNCGFEWLRSNCGQHPSLLSFQLANDAKDGFGELIFSAVNWRYFVRGHYYITKPKQCIVKGKSLKIAIIKCVLFDSPQSHLMTPVLCTSFKQNNIWTGLFRKKSDVRRTELREMASTLWRRNGVVGCLWTWRVVRLCDPK